MDFEKVNERKESRFNIIASFTHRLPRWLVLATKYVKNIFGIKKLGLRERIIRLNNIVIVTSV